MGMTERERKAKLRVLHVAYTNAYNEIARLCKIGTDAPRANAALREAENAFRRKDYGEVAGHIAEAVLTARGSTYTFITMFSVEVMDLIDWLRSIGVNVHGAWPRLSAAKNELERKAYGRSARLLIKCFESVAGVSPQFHNTLMDLVMAQYNLTLAESFGLDMSQAWVSMRDAFEALGERDYDEARRRQWKTRKEVRRAVRGYQEVFRIYATANETIEKGEAMGTDLGEARRLLDRGVEKMEGTYFEQARPLFEAALDISLQANKGLVEDAV